MKPVPVRLVAWSLVLACPGFAPLVCAQVKENTNHERVFEFGFEQRVRNENWNNIFDYNDSLDDEREQIRYRTRVWAKAPLTSSIDFFVGMNQETNQKFGKVNQFDEVVFDSAYLDFKKLFVKGLALRVGRQDIVKGEGFLLLEGNPGDGSRSIYFNAANLSYSFRKSKIEFMGILDPDQDRYLPRIHDRRKALLDYDEQAVGVYYTGNYSPRTSLESYYFYKKEVRCQLPMSSAQFRPDRHVSTAGARVVRKLTPTLSATGEFAGQWGAQHGGVSIGGWAGYGYLRRNFQRRWKPYVMGGYWGFSGDDPNTKNKNEGWDPLFSRWPKWSELYIYSQFREVGVGYWTNTGMWQGEAGFAPAKPLAFRFTYYHMDAFHPFPGDVRTFGTGTRRGEMFQTRMDVVANKNWKGHILWENLLSGDYYRNGVNAWFLRFEATYQITGALHAGSF